MGWIEVETFCCLWGCLFGVELMLSIGTRIAMAKECRDFLLSLALPRFGTQTLSARSESALSPRFSCGVKAIVIEQLFI